MLKQVHEATHPAARLDSQKPQAGNVQHDSDQQVKTTVFEALVKEEGEEND